MTHHVTLVVRADVPDGVTPGEWCDYVEDEVKANVGSRHPSDFLHHLDRDSVWAAVLPKGNREQQIVTQYMEIGNLRRSITEAVTQLKNGGVPQQVIEFLHVALQKSEAKVP